MKCTEYRSEIEGTDGRTGLGPQAQAHVEECARCHDFYTEQVSIARLVGELSRVEAPNDFEFRLRARLAAAESAARPSMLRRGFVPGTISIALATLFVFAVALSLQLRRKQDTGRAPARAEKAVPATDEVAVQTGAAPPGQSAPAAALAVLKEGHHAAVEVAAQHAQHNVSFTEGRGSLRGQKAKRSDTEPDDGFSFRRAPSLGTPEVPGTEVALTNPPIAVPVPSSAQPIRVVLSDAHGATSVVPMKSVSFGAQQLVGQFKESAREAVAAKEGVW